MNVRRWTDQVSYMIGTSEWSVDEPGFAFYEDAEDRISFKVSVVTRNGKRFIVNIL